ncbi:ABC transporter substrate-binding protein [Brevibacterium samyangense]|uniref:Solute-binding protein family 3/N-terminal domain-containing protein n=1 Tax=Brevibacterium samyangense TaxID=366888 RepID=A0ABN2TLP4_9MICO
MKRSALKALSPTALSPTALVPTALALVGLLALTGCGGAASASGTEGAGGSEASGFTPVQEGKLTVCSEMPYEPFEFVNDAGETVGFDVDIATALADDLGLELEVISTSFEGIQSGVALDAGQCDLAMAGMAITEERATKMDFSKPILNDNLALMAHKDSGFTSIEDVTELKVGVQQATTSETVAEERGVVSPVQFEELGLLTQSVAAKQIDAGIANVSAINTATQQDPNLVLVEDLETGEVLGAAVKKGNTELLEAFESNMTDLRESGEYDAIVEEWFGAVADEARVTDEDLAAFGTGN